jgi:hypothetical protein
MQCDVALQIRVRRKRKLLCSVIPVQVIGDVGEAATLLCKWFKTACSGGASSSIVHILKHVIAHSDKKLSVVEFLVFMCV